MADSRLIELIRAFSPEEKATFPLFLGSPFFVQESTAEDMQRLYQCLSLAADDALPDKSAIHAAVFPDKPYSEARLERAMTRFGQLAEQFLVAKHYHREDNEQQRQLDLAGIFKEKQLVRMYEKQMRQIKKETSNALKESTDTHLFRYKLTKIEHEWKSLFNAGKNDLSVPALIENLDFFYCCERTEMLNRFLLQQKLTTLEMPDAVRRALEPLPNAAYYAQHSPLFQIRQSIQNLLGQKAPGKADFEALMALMKQHEKNLSDEIIPELYTFIRNVCTVMTNNGDMELIGVLHEINKDNLDKGYFYINDRISANALLSITRVAILADQVPWTSAFLEAHRHRILTQEEPEEIFKMNLALCFFAEKKFEEALSLISWDVKYLQYVLLAKRLELMAYYELGSDLLFYKIDAFRKFFERTAPKTFSGTQLIFNTNFINLLQQLSHVRTKDPKRSAAIIERIYKKKLTAERIWLLEKARSLA
jgi:hypothetical protein